MSEPDDITRLKTTVEVYERELFDVTKQLVEATQSAPKGKIGDVATMLFVRSIETQTKLLNAYREYVKALEPLVPR